jgi:hypothetical protein
MIVVGNNGMKPYVIQYVPVGIRIYPAWKFHQKHFVYNVSPLYGATKISISFHHMDRF